MYNNGKKDWRKKMNIKIDFSTRWRIVPLLFGLLCCGVLAWSTVNTYAAASFSSLKPMGVMATAVKTSIAVSWEPVEGAEGYTIYEAEKTGPYSPVLSTEQTSYIKKACTKGKIPAGKNYPPEIPTGDTVHVSVLALDRKDWEAGSGYGMLIVCDNLTRVMWQNCKSYGLWRGWLPIATAERPRGYTVALASGINMFANNSIYKKQNGEVVINLSFTSSKEIAHESVIGTLPEGFRPASRLEIAFWMRGSGGGTISIGTNGAMTVYKTGNIAANTPCFINSLTYLAAP